MTKSQPMPYEMSSDNTSILLLWIINVLFIISALIPIDGNAINYAITVLICVLLFSYLVFVKRIDMFKYQPGVFLILTLVIILLLFPIVHKHDLYIRLFIVKLILLVFLFKTSNVTKTDFTKIINATYLVYLAFSILAWIKVLPGLHSVNSFIYNIGPFNIETLYGISGSTADIDTYSGIIFLWNLFVYKGKYRNLMMLISFVALVLTFRGTPIVAVAASLAVYVVIRSRMMAFISLLSILIGLISTLFILNAYSDAQVFFLSSEKDWYSLFWDVTHARSALWNNQISLYLNNFAWFQYIYGPDLQTMTVYFTRPDGLELEENYNPHSSYLITLYRSTVFFIILYISFLYFGVRTFTRRYFPVIFSIALAALTNSSLFGLENPVYILMIVYIFTQYEKTYTTPDFTKSNSYA